MTRKSVVLVVLATVVLAGCAGTNGTGTPTPESPSEDGSSVDVEEIPGVTNGTVTNATALVEANGATLVETGGRVSASQSTVERTSEILYTIGSGGSYSFTTTRSEPSGDSLTVDYWSNETATYVRSQTEEGTRYRVIERAPSVLDQFNSSLETYLAAGTFTVTNESTDPTTVVLTADEFTVPDDDRLFGDATSLNGRLVLSQAGQVQNFTLTGQVDGETVSFRYELRQPIIERASQPGWVSEVPESASLQPELTVDVRNSSYLVVENSGGDRVPENATLQLGMNETSRTVAFDAALEPGDARYAYIAASDGTLQLSADQPASDATASLTSPVSLSITTDDGVSLYSGSFGWESAGVDAGTEGESEGGSAGGN